MFRLTLKASQQMIPQAQKPPLPHGRKQVPFGREMTIRSRLAHSRFSGRRSQRKILRALCRQQVRSRLKKRLSEISVMVGHVFCSIGIYVDTVNFMTYVNTVNNVDSEYF